MTWEQFGWNEMIPAKCDLALGWIFSLGETSKWQTIFDNLWHAHFSYYTQAAIQLYVGKLDEVRPSIVSGGMEFPSEGAPMERHILKSTGSERQSECGSYFYSWELFVWCDNINYVYTSLFIRSICTRAKHLHVYELHSIIQCINGKHT